MSFESSKVKVFPSIWRQYDLNSKYTSEANFTNIIKSITDRDSFVISYDSGILEVVIYGYYFKLTEYTPGENTTLYIKVDPITGALVSFNTESSSPTEMDKDGYCLFLVDSTTETGSNIHSLQVTKNGQIVNKIKISSDSVYFGSGDNTTSLTEKVNDIEDDKQDNISAGDGISFSSNTVSINNEEKGKLDSLEDKGSNKQFVYFGANGQAIECSQTLGKSDTTNNKFQMVYLKNGEFTAGPTIHFSTSSPGPSDGEDGDIWFKYNN